MDVTDWVTVFEKQGQRVRYEGAILFFVVPAEEYEDTNTYKNLSKLVKEIGYNKSWGFKPERKSNDNGEN